MKPGRIVIEWNEHGTAEVQAPTGDADVRATTILMLLKAGELVLTGGLKPRLVVAPEVQAALERR